jgi:NAD-dependent deacetylase
MKHLKKLVALTGAGISAESGITTFRDSGGLWEQYDVMEVASIDGWHKNPQLMQRFYNDRRKQLEEVEPNAAHRILAELEKNFDVTVVTQNVDNLHERAGSTKIIHLHGELTKARSSINPNLIIDVGYRPIEWGEKAPDGSQLRPHIVWFGEAVPMIETAAEIVAVADILVIIGTSLNVYPAAGLVGYADRKTPIYLIDPNDVSYSGRNITIIREKATVGMEKLKNIIINH